MPSIHVFNSILVTNPICFYKTFKTNKTHHHVSSSSYALNSKNNITEIPIKESHDFYEKPTTQLSLKPLVDEIKGLPFKEKHQIITVQKLNGDLGTIFEFNELLLALVVAEEPYLALKLFDEMSSYGLEPDSWTFSVIIRCYCENNDFDEAESVLRYMLDNGFVPNFSAVNILMNSLCKKGKLQRAFGVLDLMGGIGFKPTIGLNVDKKMMNSLLRGLCRRFCRGRKEDLFRDAYQFFEKMKNDGNVFESSTYDLVIQTLCIGKKIDEASVSLQTMIRMGFSPQIITLNGVIQALCVEGKANEALFVLVLLNEGGIVPSRGSYNLLIDGLNKHGNFFGACNVYGAAVKRGLIPSKKPQQ
ncbi:hypothetical protein CsatA_022339 [Cannabis sativa]